MTFTLNVEASNALLHVAYEVVHTGQQLRYPIRLVTSPCPFGGKRWWFLCPLTVVGKSCVLRSSRPGSGADAGGGKSYNLRWLDYELSAPPQPVLAFAIPNRYFDRIAEFIPKVLVPMIRSIPTTHPTGGGVVDLA